MTRWTHTHVTSRRHKLFLFSYSSHQEGQEQIIYCRFVHALSCLTRSIDMTDWEREMLWAEFIWPLAPKKGGKSQINQLFFEVINIQNPNRECVGWWLSSPFSCQISPTPSDHYFLPPFCLLTSPGPVFVHADHKADQAASNQIKRDVFEHFLRLGVGVRGEAMCLPTQSK